MVREGRFDSVHMKGFSSKAHLEHLCGTTIRFAHYVLL